MAIVALSMGGKFDVVSNVELLHIEKLKETDEQAAKDYERTQAARYYLRLPTSSELARLTNLMAPVRGNGMWRVPQMGEAQAYAALEFLIGWDNINDEKGNPIEFEGRRGDDGRICGATADDVSILPESERDCILNAIVQKCQVAKRDLS